MLFKEDTVARADAMAIRKAVGFYRWTPDLARNTPLRWTKTVKSSTT